MRKRYRISGEFPARKEGQYLFAKDEADLCRSLSEYTKIKIREGKIKIEYDGEVDW